MNTATALAAYGVGGIVNLLAAWRGSELIRKITKCLLMPVLVVAYLLGASPVLPWIIVALALSWVGDVLLIRKEEPLFFRLGLVAFLLGHVGYVVGFLLLAEGLHLIALVISILVAIPACYFMLRFVDASAQMRVPVAAYGIVIFAMSVAAVQLMLAHPMPGGILVFLGALVFMYSDAQMAYLLFHQQPKHFNVITMIPYIVAQGLIVIGLIVPIAS